LILWCGCSFLDKSSDEEEDEEEAGLTEGSSSGGWGRGGGSTGGASGGSSGGGSGGSSGGGSGGSSDGGSTGGSPWGDSEDCDTGYSYRADTGDWDWDEHEDTGVWGMDSCEAEDLRSRTGEVASGSTHSACDNFYLGCGGRGGRDLAFEWSPPSSGTWTIRTRGSGFDTLLGVFSEDCDEQIECDDDGDRGLTSRITRYFSSWEDLVIIVDGYSRGERGDFVLRIVEGEVEDTGWMDDTGAFDAEADLEVSDGVLPAYCVCTPDESTPEFCDSW